MGFEGAAQVRTGQLVGAAQAQRAARAILLIERSTCCLLREIVGRIAASGRAYLTQTKLRGQTVMRIGLGNVLTTEQHLRNLWEMIQSEVDRVLRTRC